MKPLLTLLILLHIHITSIFSQEHNITIEGQIIGYDGKSEVKYCISSVSNGMDIKIVKPDSLGRFTISKYIEKTEFFSFYGAFNGKYHICKLLLQPNEHYSFISEGRDEDDWLNPYCPDIYKIESTSVSDNKSFYRIDLPQVQYNQIHNNIHGVLFSDEWDLNQPDLLLETLQKKINKHLRVFEHLLLSNEIDNEFYDIAKMNIEYMYAERLAGMIQHAICPIPKYQMKDSVVRKKLCDVYPKIFEIYPVKGASMENLFNYKEYTDLYLEFREDYKDGVYDPVLRKGNSMLDPIYAKSGEVLSEEVNKHYQLNTTICNTAYLVPNALKHSKDYIDEHPEVRGSWGGQLLEDVLIPNAEEYEKLKELPLPEGIFILDGKEVNSLSDLVKQFKGKTLLIDCWGTWCMPCRNQFYYMDSLKTVLYAKGMDMIYIAFEYLIDKQKWESIIKAYDLKGFHLIANDELKDDIKSTVGELMNYPNFIIIDKNGEVAVKEAALASDGDKLYKQILDIIE